MGQKVLTVFFVALLIRLLFLFILSWHGYGQDFWLSGDTGGYVGIAQNLATHGVYSSDSIGLVPENHRPPLYPLFLVPFVVSNSSVLVVGFVQNVLVSSAAVFLYVLGRKVFRESVAFGAALVFAIEPAGALLSNVLMSEALFVFFFVPAIFFLVLFIHTQKNTHLFFASASLALASLTRAIAFYFVFLIPLAVLLACGKKIPWRATLVGLCVFYLVVSPWLVFNLVTFSSLQFSSTANINLYKDNVVQFERWLYPEKEPFFDSPENIKIILGGDEGINRAERAAKLGKAARDFILDHAFKYSVFHALYMPRLFIHDGYVYLYESLSGGKTSFSSIPLYHDLVTLNLGTLREKITHTPSILVPFFPKLFFVGISFLAFLHLFLSWKKEEKQMRKVSLFLVGFVLVYAFLVSPVGQERLRFVIHPVLFLLALDSLRILKEKYNFRFRLLDRVRV